MGIPTPNFNLLQTSQPNVLRDYAEMTAIKGEQQQQQLRAQQMQGVQQENQMRQLQLEDQQKLRQAGQGVDWSAPNAYDSYFDSAVKAGVSPMTLGPLRQQLMQQQELEQRMTKEQISNQQEQNAAIRSQLEAYKTEITAPGVTPDQYQAIYDKHLAALSQVPGIDLSRVSKQALLPNQIEGVENGLTISSQRLNAIAREKSAEKPNEWNTALKAVGWDGESPVTQDLANQAMAKIAAQKTTAAEPHDAFHEWLSNPTQYEEFMKKMADLKANKGAYGSFGPAFLAYHMLNQAYAYNPKLLPVLAPMLAKMFESGGEPLGPGAKAVLAAPPTDQPVSPETGEAIGVRQPSAPTGATRSRSQFALSGVLQELPRVKTEIGALQGQLGPVQGRWQEFMAGKVGANNPRFSGLRTSLSNIATAWMRLHANSESARQEFEDILSRSKTADDLLANLNAIGAQAQNYYKQELGYGEIGPKQAAPNQEKGSAPQAHDPLGIY